jgi:hypothetical protein
MGVTKLAWAHAMLTLALLACGESDNVVVIPGPSAGTGGEGGAQAGGMSGTASGGGGSTGGSSGSAGSGAGGIAGASGNGGSAGTVAGGAGGSGGAAGTEGGAGSGGIPTYDCSAIADGPEVLEESGGPGIIIVGGAFVDGTYHLVQRFNPSGSCNCNHRGVLVIGGGGKAYAANVDGLKTSGELVPAETTLGFLPSCPLGAAAWVWQYTSFVDGSFHFKDPSNDILNVYQRVQ